MTSRFVTIVYALVYALALVPGASVFAADDEKKSVWYDDGLHLHSGSGSYTALINWRAQLRYSNTDFDNDFGNPNADKDELRLNRARFKIGGKLGASWLDYYAEYDFVRSALLDFWLAPKISEALNFRIGQYKVPYNRERFDSSGKQQFAERSIVTPPFTLDRQIGVTAMGRLFRERTIDSSYFVGVFLGNGRSSSRDSDGKPMVFGRWQWNIFKRVLPFSRSDIDRTRLPTASFAVGAASNRSAFTRFSSDGGGELPAFSPGEEGQYGVDQAMVEFAFMYQGFSIQTEYHWKQIDDRVNQTSSELSGFYFDTGFFFSEVIDWFPEPLELIARMASIDPNAANATPEESELALGGNWYFRGHRNKLTLDVTRTTGKLPSDNDDFWGVRLQWDVSF
jgi:phosphate-selective porin